MICPRSPVTLTFWPWKWCASHVHVTWATAVPILVFLGLFVLDLDLMYATDRRQTDRRQHHRLMPPPRGAGHNNSCWTTYWTLHHIEFLLITAKNSSPTTCSWSWQFITWSIVAKEIMSVETHTFPVKSIWEQSRPSGIIHLFIHPSIHSVAGSESMHTR